MKGPSKIPMKWKKLDYGRRRRGRRKRIGVARSTSLRLPATKIR